MLSLSGHGISTLVLGVDNLLLRPTPVFSHSEQGTARRELFYRMVLDPRREPLGPLFSSKEGVAAEAPALLTPFYNGAPPSETYLKVDFYDGYEGSTILREELTLLRDGGVALALWDNCASGTTARLHSLIDRYYGGLFPRSIRFFSTSHHTQLGKDDFLEILMNGLKASADTSLLVTANPGHRDYALRRGFHAFLAGPEARETPSYSLIASLTNYLGATFVSSDGVPARIQDPVAYLTAIGAFVNDQDVDAKVRSLPPGHPLREDLRRIREEFTNGKDSGNIGFDVRCWLVDQRLHREDGLADFFENHTLPRFKATDAVKRDVLSTAEGYLSQVERRIPKLARAALEALMGEIAPLCRIPDPALLALGVVQEIEKRVRTHIVQNHRLYVEETGIFHDDEWAELSDIFHLEHDVLDQRYEKWIVDTERMLREKIANGEPMKASRKLVKERLIEDLVLTVMELEMMVRSFEEGTPRPMLFPRHHDAKNRAATLTLNIRDKKAWKEAILLTTKTVQGWMQGMVSGHVRRAKESGVSLRFGSMRDASLPALELSDMTESEREAVTSVVTELVTNAIKYRRDVADAEVHVEVSEGVGEFSVTVEDNGVGINDVQRVLNGFREHPEGHDGYGGGLASILRHVGANDGWDLAITSEPGLGTRIRLNVVLRDRDCQKKRMSDSGFPIG